MSARPGEIRDAIRAYLAKQGKSGASITDIQTAVNSALGRAVSSSSVRSYLNINTPEQFERLARGFYKLRGGK